MSRQERLVRRTEMVKSELAKAIESRFPDLTPAERLQAEEFLIKKIAKGLTQGKEVAVVDVDANGDVDMTIYFVSDAIEQAVREVSKRRRSG